MGYSNYGQLGTQAVNMYTSLSQNNRAQDSHDSNQNARDLKAEQASIANLTLEAEYEQAGGRDAYVKQMAKLAKEQRAIKMQQAQLDLTKKQAQINKTNAQAAKAAMKRAATVTGGKKKKVKARTFIPNGLNNQRQP